MANTSGAGHNPIASAQLGLCPKPPETIRRLVDRFDRDRAVFQSGDYKEEQLRLEFLNPLFEALGWSINDEPINVCAEQSRWALGATEIPDTHPSSSTTQSGWL